MEPINPRIAHKGQRYVQEIYHLEPKRPSELENAVARCFRGPEIARERPLRLPVPYLVELNWR